MLSIFNKLLAKLEDPKYPLIGRNVKLLKYSFLLSDTERNNKIGKFLIMMMSLFVFTQYLEIYLLRSSVSTILQILKYVLLGTIIVVKVFTFVLWQDRWKEIINFVNEVNYERLNSGDEVAHRINEKYTKYCIVITSLYIYLLSATILLILAQPSVNYYIDNVRLSDDKEIEATTKVIIINSYTFFGNSQAGFWYAVVHQVYGVLYGCFCVVSFDTNAICIMVFFRIELEMLTRDSQILYGVDTPVSEEEAKKRLSKCQKRHQDLMKYFQLFDSCLSPIMLLYVIICSVMLCATAYQIRIETSAMQKFITSEYLLLGVLQLFLFCWHSNEVLYVSKDLKFGPYESSWWKRSVLEQKELSILTDQFNKEIAFSAGPFTNITVTTFINIVKGAYSYYTLLNKSGG